MTARAAGVDGPMRLAIFDNLANSAYIQAKVLRQLGYCAEVVLDPMDRHVMSDPRWEELDIELPAEQLAELTLPAYDLPDWVRRAPGSSEAPAPSAKGRMRLAARLARSVPGMVRETGLATRTAGWRGAQMALQRAWVVRTLASYDCVIAYGMGPAWAALAGVPAVAETWGGDITMVPFYDTGDWEGHGQLQLPGPRGELYAQAKLQRLGYAHAGRILLTDPRFVPYAERLGHSAKCVHIGFVIDTVKYAPGPEPQLREVLLGRREGLIVFMPSRQDWFWKGSDRLLRGFAAATADRDDVVLVCAGWGADLERSKRLIAELRIGNRVRLVRGAMSKGRLRRYYRAADIVADQFTVGSYGGSALEAMSCARPLLIKLNRQRFEGRFDSFPPVANVSEPSEIDMALRQLIDDPSRRAQLGAHAREWVIANHGPALAQRVLELCRDVIDESVCAGRRPVLREGAAEYR